MSLPTEPSSRELARPVQPPKVRDLADEVYASLRRDGLETREIVQISTRLLELVTERLRAQPQ